MSEVRKGRARGTAGRTGSGADTTTAPDATSAPEVPVLDTPDAPEVVTETSATGADGGSDAGTPGNAPGAGESGAPVAGSTVGDGVGWADVVPFLALRVGSVPSPMEVRFAPVVWQMLNEEPGRTVLQMAADAELRGIVGLDPATLGRVLARYERTGVAHSINGGPVSRWFIVGPGEFLAQAQQGADAVAAGARTTRTTASATTATGVGVGARVAPGGLRGMVEDHLAEHPFQEFSPSQLSRELGKSSGAIANALERLVETGAAIRTSESPRRYQHRPDPDATTADAGSDADAAE